MIAINANRFFHLAAACSALLLSGVLAAQTADAPKPRKDHDEPYLDHDADVANLNKPGRRAQPQKKDSDQLPPVDGGAVDQDYGDDRQQIGTLDPVPQPAALELSQRIDDAGAHLTLRRDGDEAFLGAVLAARMALSMTAWGIGSSEKSRTLRRVSRRASKASARRSSSEAVS